MYGKVPHFTNTHIHLDILPHNSEEYTTISFFLFPSIPPLSKEDYYSWKKIFIKSTDPLYTILKELYSEARKKIIF